MCDKEKCTAWGLTFLRVVVAVILISHGWPKLFGDEQVKAGLVQFFSSTVLPSPAAMVTLAGVLEVFGGAMLLLGFYTKYAVAALTVEFLVIILFVRLKMGWSSMELDMLILAALQVLGGAGSGALSVEGMMGKKESDSVPVQAGMQK